jgi:hypothetical protein
MSTVIRAPRPIPRWSEWAAHAIPLCVLPSSLWRLGARFGPHDWYDPRFSLASTLYLIFLSALSEGLALLAFGLVRPWGEVVPHWIPFLGGRRVRPLTAVVPAALGTLTLFALYAYVLLQATHVTHVHFEPRIGGEHSGTLPSDGPALWVLLAAYSPLLAWGPLLGALTVAYHRRRRSTSSPTRGREIT